MSNIRLTEKLHIIKNNIYKIPTNESFVSLFSGGKDSALALSIALETGNAIALIHYLDEDTDESIFHKQKRAIIEAQAKALGIPVIYQYRNWWARWNKLVKLYMDFKKRGVKYVVFGDLDANDNVKNQITLCRSAGLIPCLPLLKSPYDVLLNEIHERGIKCVISAIDSRLVDGSWLGKVFDRKAYEYFTEIGIDPFGENGEYHTTLVDADCFKHPLKYTISTKKEDSIIIDLM